MASATFRRLEVFCAVLETGGATQAGLRLNMSQPGVSQNLAKLEDELGIALFLRENGRLKPTEAALLLFEEASAAFDGLDRVLNLARDIRGFDRGLLRIAAPHVISGTYLPRALAALALEHPRLRFSVQLGQYDRIVGLVAAREVDVGIAKLPILAPGVDSVDICSSPILAVRAASRPPPSGPTLGLADLASEPLIMIGRGKTWRSDIDVAFRRAGIAPRVAVETQSVSSACGFAEAGFGTALVPEWPARTLLGTGLRGYPCDIGIEHRFVVAFPTRSPQADFASSFAEALRAAGVA